jgi:hypothetical protein
MHSAFVIITGFIIWVFTVSAVSFNATSNELACGAQ